MQSFDRFHKTQIGYLVFGLAELALCYAFASWAIDSGRLLAWTLSIILLIGAMQHIVQFIMKAGRHA